MKFKTLVYGDIHIELWEYPAMLLLLAAVFITGSRIMAVGLRTRPEYRYFLWGLGAKIVGGISFGAVYLFYYGGGDTTSYYEGALSFRNLFHENIYSFFSAYFGPGTQEVKSYFTASTGEPMWYVFADDKARFVIKLVTPIMILTGGSYFLTTLLISIVTYGGLWRLYLMFTHYFPGYARNLAVAILFMPSVIFWGSGIMKDSFTMAATCYFIVMMHRIINSMGSLFLNVLRLLFWAFIIISIKSYILIILIPGSLVWFFYDRILAIRNRLMRVLVIPFIYFTVFSLSYLTLNVLEQYFGRFGLNKAIETASIIQQDLKKDYYEGNSFDIGNFEPTLVGAISKFPQATFAGLYRPLPLESRNAVMFLSGLENLFIAALTFIVIVAVKPRVSWKVVQQNPVLLYSLIFSLLFAFMIGLTTSNFGALVRLRIPLIPLYMAVIMVLYSNTRQVKWRRKHSALITGI